MRGMFISGQRLFRVDQSANEILAHPHNDEKFVEDYRSQTGYYC